MDDLRGAFQSEDTLILTLSSTIRLIITHNLSAQPESVLTSRKKNVFLQPSLIRAAMSS